VIIREHVSHTMMQLAASQFFFATNVLANRYICLRIAPKLQFLHARSYIVFDRLPKFFCTCSAKTLHLPGSVNQSSKMYIPNTDGIFFASLNFRARCAIPVPIGREIEPETQLAAKCDALRKIQTKGTYNISPQTTDTTQERR